MKAKYFLLLILLGLPANLIIVGQDRAGETADYKKCEAGKSDDFGRFRLFVAHYYLLRMKAKDGLMDETMTFAKVHGNALSKELNYIKRGTPQQQRWNQIEKEMDAFLLCIATAYMDENRIAGFANRAIYEGRIMSVYREALIGAYEDEISASLTSAVPRFFSEKEDPANRSLSLSAEETALLGTWNNESMKWGNTSIELLPAENFIVLQADRTYQYHAHTKGANAVHTKGTWRYYRNGAKRFLALQHTHVRKAGEFQALPDRRESLFVLQEISERRLVLFEDKNDPSMSVTLIYSKFGKH